MFGYDMTHQINLEPDFVSTMGTQTSFTNNFKKGDKGKNTEYLKDSL